MPGGEEREEERRGVEESGQLAGYDVTRYLLKVKNIPLKLRKTFWMWLQPLPALSNLRIEDVNRVLDGYQLDMKLAVQEVKENKTTKITLETLRWINQAYFCLFLNLMRSVGDDRERKLIATSYRVSRGMYEERAPERGGLFGRLRR